MTSQPYRPDKLDQTINSYFVRHVDNNRKIADLLNGNGSAVRQQIENEQLAHDAMLKYNLKWTGDEWGMTAMYYRDATQGKTAQYGVRLQEHVLNLLGNPGSKKMNRIGKAGMKWVEWMTGGTK